jgi:hypothetical protein
LPGYVGTLGLVTTFVAIYTSRQRLNPSTAGEALNTSLIHPEAVSASIVLACFEG